MKKIFNLFCLLIFIFFLSGCDVQYNLHISPNGYIETVDVDYDLDESASKYFIPVFYGITDFEDPNTNFLEKSKGISYYDVSEQQNNNFNRVSYTYNFSQGNFRRSYFARGAYNNLVVKQYDHDDDGKKDYIVIATDDYFELFDRFSKLDMVTVNIECDYKVISNNASEVNKNVYTWYIYRNNIPTINLVFSPDDIVDSRSFLEKILDGNNLTILLIFSGIFVLGLIIYFLLKKRSESVNK